MKLYKLDGEEEGEVEPGNETDSSELEEIEMERPDGENCQISVQILTGSVAHNTIKVQGLVKKQVITILIDSGATHSFIDPSTVKRLGYEEEQTTPMAVTGADGNQMLTGGVCAGLTWKMEGHQFQANLRVLTLGGCDLVLGVE